MTIGTRSPTAAGYERALCYPIAAQIGWSMGAEALSNTIARLDQMPVNGAMCPSPWSHVFMVFTFPNGMKLLAESLIGKGVRISPYESLVRSRKVTGSMVGIPYRIGLAALTAMWDKALELHGCKYDYRHILGLLLWIKTRSRHYEQRPKWLDWSLNDTYICSELVGELCTAGGVNCDMGLATPATRTPHSLYRAYLAWVAERAQKDPV